MLARRRRALLRGARNPLIVAGGGDDLRRGHRRAARARRGDRDRGRRDAGRQGLAALRPPAGRSARSAPPARPRPTRSPARPTSILGVGTRWSDFTTASRSLFAARRALHQPQRRPVDAFKHAGLPLVADARLGLEALNEALEASASTTPTNDWDATVERAYTTKHQPPAQSEVHRRRQPRLAARATSSSAPRAACPATCTSSGARATRRATTSSTATRRMGYEIAGGLGVKMAAPDREVFVLVGDGSYLMMAQELVTAVAEDDQADGRPRPEPRLPVDRRAVGVASARSASARSTATAARTSVAARSTSPPTPPASAPTSARSRRSRTSRPRCARPPRRRARPSSQIDDRPDASPRPTPRRGGTCPSPRSPSWSPRAPRASSTSSDKRTQKQYLSPGERVPR